MKKKISIISLILIAFFSFVDIALAGSNISVIDRQPTSITLSVNYGLPARYPVNFSLYSSYPKYSSEQSVTSDQNGSARVSFTGLTKGVRYHGYVWYSSMGKYVNAADISFTFVDLSSLNSAIQLANSKIAIATEGTKTGQYKAGSIDTLKTAIIKADFINTDNNLAFISTQKDVDKSLAILNDAIKAFDYSKIIPLTISPTSGKVGEEVKITGTNLAGSIAVYFDTTRVVPSENSSDTSIVVNVPSQATTGKVKVVTQKITFVSDSVFTVIPDSTTTTTTTSTGTTTTTGSGSYTKPSIKFNGIVPVCNTGEINPSTGNYVNDCDFNMVMTLVNNIINFALVILATPLFAIIIIYAGFLYLTAAGNSGNVSTAKKIIQNAIIGYIIALVAWLVVKSILLSFGFTGPMYLS